MRRTVVLIMSLAAVSVGCGEDDPGSNDEKQIRSVAAAFNSAFLALYDGAPAYDRICSLATKKARASIAAEANRSHQEGGCSGLVKALQRGVLSDERTQQQTRTRLALLKRRMRHFRIQSIRIKGDTAVVTDNTSYIHGEGGPTILHKEDGRWLVDDVR
jgi:hypothetical protein